jgi:outer membrane immunogenic protein
MNKSLVSSLAGAVLSFFAGGLAFAADMQLKAAPVPASYDWTGFYAGGNVGYGWGRAPTDVNDPAVPDFTNFSFGNPPVTTFVPLPGASFSDGNRMKGINGGVQFGYNAQFGKTVLGFETDWQGVGGHAAAADNTPFDTGLIVVGPIGFEDSGYLTTQYQARIDWFGTVRGRVGYAADQILLFATGGMAYGRVSVSGTNSFTDTTLFCALAPCTTTVTTGATPFAAARINVGWTLGAGIEGALQPMSRWTWTVEYLHIDLGSLDTSVVPAISAVSAGPPPTATMHTRFGDDIVRVGLDYRFEVPGTTR